MKIEQLIVQHLYNTKKVTLQGIGSFTLNPAVRIPAGGERERDFEMPGDAISFEYNLRAKEDDDLVKFIVQQTNKILPLASADLDSYVMLAKQFLNIGKPLVIEGVGTIQKNQAGIYQFIHGSFVAPRIDDIPKQLKEKKEEDVSFESEATVDNSRRNLMIFFTILILASTALGIYYMVTHREPVNILPLNEPVAKPQTIAADTIAKAVADTPSTAVVTPSVAKTDSSNFRIVLKTYSTEKAARAAYDRLKSYGHKVFIIPVDSASYDIALKFYTPLSDTTRAKDSLRTFFGGKPAVKL